MRISLTTRDLVSGSERCQPCDLGDDFLNLMTFYLSGHDRRERMASITYVHAHGAKVPFFAADGMGTMGTMVQTGTHPQAPDHVLTTSPPSFDIATKSLPRYPVWLSTIWVALSIALLFDGHPVTASLPLLFWFLHRRWECLQMKIITYREVPSGGRVQLARQTGAAAGERTSQN
jgi:hypothetical protein